MKMKYMIISLLLVGLYACKKGDSYDLSKVTVFAEFEYEPEVILSVGEPFTPSAIATEGETTLDVNIVGSADVNSIGVYEIIYSATNSDGYDGAVTQIVIVHNPNGSGTDVSGVIYDTDTPARTGEIYLVEGTSNMYYCTDMGGSGVLPVYFEMNGDVMNVVDQPWHYSTVNGAEGTYNPGTQTFDITFSTGWNYVFAYQ
jgi:hypothetical protein